MISMFQQALADLIVFFAKQLRAIESKRAKGDADRLHEIRSLSDSELVRKWLWVMAIFGAPVCFIALPFMLSMIQPLLYPWLGMSLWIIAKVAMVVVFLIFVVAVLFTLRSSN